MEIAKLLQRLSKLRKIAEAEAGSPEGDNAAGMAARIQEHHRLNLEGDDLAMHEEEVKVGDASDRDLGYLLGDVLPVEVSVGVEKIKFRGMKVAVREAVKHFKVAHAALERITGFVAVGYLIGTFGPDVVFEYVEKHETSATIKAGMRAQTEAAEQRDITEEEAKLLLEAAKIGKPIEFWDGIQNEP